MISAQLVAVRALRSLYRPVQPLILVNCVDEPRLLFKHKARSTDVALQAYSSSCKVTMNEWVSLMCRQIHKLLL